jgi:hypothetical protein
MENGGVEMGLSNFTNHNYSGRKIKGNLGPLIAKDRVGRKRMEVTL